ncbi:trypsin-like cysteine/serine peptidase domain-containing protein [Aspergillus spectabilis]
MTRTLRSANRQTTLEKPEQQPLQPGFNNTVKCIRTKDPLPGLSHAETRLLRKKQRRLHTSSTNLRTVAASYGEHITTALKATFIFAQHEAGTAVCVDSRGWILTCAHCFGESEEEWREDRYKWLLTYNGVAVRVECLVWDTRRDLALARVVCVEAETAALEFAYIAVPERSAVSSSKTYTCKPIICIGQPGADDLESATPRETGYELVSISEGRLRELVPGADPQDNSEIGTLKHDAWTYWGHSGAPLVCEKTGVLLGLHSSWDEDTAMRHGVPAVAVAEFLTTHLATEGRELSESEVIVIVSD